MFCVVGDGEAETGPLAASWHSNKFVDPAVDGTVIPILALNGYKIANPTILARIRSGADRACSRATATQPHIVAGDDPMAVHARWRRPWTRSWTRSIEIKRGARATASTERPTWPMIILRTPKGWTGPKSVDGKPTEGTWPVAPGPARRRPRRTPSTSRQLEDWLRSYRPEELFDADGRAAARDARLSRRVGYATDECQPARQRRPAPARTSTCPTSGTTPSTVAAPGDGTSEATRVLGSWLRDMIRDNPTTFRLFGPGRDALEPAGRRLRGDRPGLDGRDRGRRTSTWRRRAGSWRSCRSTSARAGWRATS